MAGSGFAGLHGFGELGAVAIVAEGESGDGGEVGGDPVEFADAIGQDAAHLVGEDAVVHGFDDDGHGGLADVMPGVVTDRLARGY